MNEQTTERDSDPGEYCRADVHSYTSGYAFVTWRARLLFVWHVLRHGWFEARVAVHGPFGCAMAPPNPVAMTHLIINAGGALLADDAP